MTQRAVRVQQAGTSKDHWAPRHTFPRSMAERAYGFHQSVTRPQQKDRNEAPQHHDCAAPSSRVGLGD